MPDREPKKPTATPTESASSAPVLPAKVAKQYGLHHHATHGKKQTTAAPEATVAPADQLFDDAAVLPVLSDPKTDAAVDEIVASESDELLAAKDALQQGKPLANQPKSGFWSRITGFLKAWVASPRARWITLIIIFLLTAAVILTPQARYFVLNSIGVRSSASVTVIDDTTNLPLKNVTVRIAGQTTRTNVDGKATITNLKLGPTTLDVRRLAFRAVTKPITIGWGSNPQVPLELTATGLQYTISVHDYVSGKPLADAEVSGQDLNALSDKQGVITFTVSERDPQPIDVSLTKKGYYTQKIMLKPATPTVGKLQLIPSGKTFFMSNQSGTYDLFTTNVDGSDKKLILAGTGNESSASSLVVAPAGDWAALVSTRGQVRSRDGYLLQAITLINQDGSTVTTLERAEQIRLIDWVGTKVIYTVTVAGASAAHSQRSRLISYDYAANSRVQLATANQFNAVHLMKGVIYYALAGTDPAVKPALFKIKPDGSGRQTVWDQEVWTVWRTSYTTLALQTPSGWFRYMDGGTPASMSDAAPDKVRQYSVHADGSRAAWLDTRDGKAVVMVAGTDGTKETQIVKADGITYPLRWLNDTTLIYRVVTNAETADYVVSTGDTPPKKITDLVNTYGFTRF